MKSNDRTWERLYAVSQALFSFHASRAVLFFRGLVFLALGILGLKYQVTVLKIVTMGIGGVLLLFAVSSLLLAWKNERVSVSLLLLFVLLGVAGGGLLFFNIESVQFVMFIFGLWLILVGLWGIFSAQKRFRQFVLPMPGLVATLIGILLVIAPFRGDVVISWASALLLTLFGAQMLLLSLGVDAGKWVFQVTKKEQK